MNAWLNNLNLSVRDEVLTFLERTYNG